MHDVVGLAEAAFAECEPKPTLTIRGINGGLVGGTRIDLSTVHAAFSALADEWNQLYEAGAVDALWPETGIAEIGSTLLFLANRVSLLPPDAMQGSPLRSLRKAITAITGALVERSIAKHALTFQSREAHQLGTVAIYGKKQQRRARRSTTNILMNLQLAENASHAASVLKAQTGSSWLSIGSARLKGLLAISNYELRDICNPFSIFNVLEMNRRDLRMLLVKQRV